jgi:Putative DNA-binding domain
MPALRELQIGFAAALTNREAAARFAPGVRARGLAAERRLQVYRNNLFASLTEVLAAVYPVTRRLVGEAYFGHAARGYIAAHPSRSGDVHRYGGCFAEYLGGCPGSEALVYLPDTARLEWDYHNAFHAEQHSPLDPDDLRAVAPEDYPRLRLMLQPSARLLASDYPVLRIWRVNQPDWTDDPTVDLAERRAPVDPAPGCGSRLHSARRGRARLATGTHPWADAARSAAARRRA